MQQNSKLFWEVFESFKEIGNKTNEIEFIKDKN